jgi:hypothetical protein
VPPFFFWFAVPFSSISWHDCFDFPKAHLQPYGMVHEPDGPQELSAPHGFRRLHSVFPGISSPKADRPVLSNSGALIKGRLKWMLRSPCLTVEDANDLRPIIGVKEPYLNYLNGTYGIPSWFHGNLFSLNRAIKFFVAISAY